MSIGHASGAGRNGAQLRPAGRSGSRSPHDVADPGANGGTLYGAFRSTCSREISIVAPASLPRRPIIACRRQPVPEARRAGEGRLGQRPISRGKHPSPVREQPLRGTLQGAMPFLHQVGWATPHAPLRVFAAGRGGCRRGNDVGYHRRGSGPGGSRRGSFGVRRQPTGINGG